MSDPTTPSPRPATGHPRPVDDDGAARVRALLQVDPLPDAARERMIAVALAEYDTVHATVGTTPGVVVDLGARRARARRWLPAAAAAAAALIVAVGTIDLGTVTSGDEVASLPTQTSAQTSTADASGDAAFDAAPDAVMGSGQDTTTMAVPESDARPAPAGVGAFLGEFGTFAELVDHAGRVGPVSSRSPGGCSIVDGATIGARDATVGTAVVAGPGAAIPVEVWWLTDGRVLVVDPGACEQLHP